MEDNRQLTDQEMRVFNKVLLWEKLYQDRYVTAVICLTLNSFNVLKRMNIVNPIKVEYNQNKLEYEVTLTLADHWRYVQACCKAVGITVDLEGTIRTHDNLVVHRNCTIL